MAIVADSRPIRMNPEIKGALDPARYDDASQPAAAGRLRFRASRASSSTRLTTLPRTRSTQCCSRATISPSSGSRSPLGETTTLLQVDLDVEARHCRRSPR